MNSSSVRGPIGFPRYFRVAGYWINSYKVMLIVGLYVGTLATAAVGESAGRRPLGIGVAAMSSALLGLAGARLYHVLIHARYFFSAQGRSALWNTEQGGWGVFGALITFVPASWLAASLLDMPAGELWDDMSAGVLAGGFWIRLGCVFNGCCVGRETTAVWGVVLHDTHGCRKRRVPVQFLEMFWWLAGLAVFLAVWPTPLASGSYALGVLTWYGFGRFFLEPLREHVETVGGVGPINRIVAAVLALSCGLTLIYRL